MDDSLSREDVEAVVGDGDPTITSRILSFGATRDEFRSAEAWLNSGGAATPDEHDRRERVRALAELMAAGKALSGR